MNTKIVFTRNCPVRTSLVNETTGQELYKIETPHQLVRRVTRVFRCDPATPPIPSFMPRLHWDVNNPHEGYGSRERKIPAGDGEKDGSEDKDKVDDAVDPDESPAEDSPLVENEVARWYWKVFKSTRIAFEGETRTRAEFLPFKSRLKGTRTFTHNGVSYCWSRPASAWGRPRLVIDDSNKTLIAQFHETGPLKKRKSYLEVTPAGMGMLDHIVVTLIPVDAARRHKRH